MLSYATAFDYLLRLGERFTLIGRSELCFDGIAKAADGYPLLLVEGDAQGSDVYQDSTPSGVESFTLTVQVLTVPEGSRLPAPAALSALLAETKGWAEALTEQLRQEHPGCLVGVNKLALPAIADSALATGWRVELSLKLCNDLDRAQVPALFTPEPDAR